MPMVILKNNDNPQLVKVQVFLCPISCASLLQFTWQQGEGTRLNGVLEGQEARHDTT